MGDAASTFCEGPHALNSAGEKIKKPRTAGRGGEGTARGKNPGADGSLWLLPCRNSPIHKHTQIFLLR